MQQFAETNRERVPFFPFSLCVYSEARVRGPRGYCHECLVLGISCTSGALLQRLERIDILASSSARMWN